MDDTAVAAILAVPVDLLGADSEKFFDLVIDAYPGGEGPELDEFLTQVREREPSFSTAVETFEENLKAEGLDRYWPDITRAFVNEAGTGARLDQLREQLEEEAEFEEEPADEADAPVADSGGWEAFCAENRAFWLGWDGADWAGWRAAFAEGAVGAGVGADLDPHLSWMDGLDLPGRLAYLRDTLGFSVNEEALAGAGSGGWEAFCAENRDFWQGWDGADWDTWRAAFAEGAAGAGVGADLDPHLSWMDGLDLPGRLAYLRDTLGFSVSEEAFAEASGAAPAGDVGAQPSEAEVSAAIEAAEQAIQGLPPEQQVIPPEIVSEMFKEFPEAAFMDPAEIATVIRDASLQIAASA
ncbi:hypothetical protein OG943_09655 [Amycolatopsis sp. NBC_00345]|uniref:hypothetical protein n=1 Tax=Amycolatopsis sp. NBC_00345 TaxID=2975955 RepID=UPI002E252C37